MLSLPDLPRVHDRYLALTCLARERLAGVLGGKLLFCSGLEAESLAALIAASIAGTASLSVQSDSALSRAALRTGLCDFVVGHLDEALRILKNELRRGLPVSVCLSAEPQACIDEMIVRGVQPDLLFWIPAGAQDRAQIFAERGAIRLPTDAVPPPDTSLLVWSVDSGSATTMPRIARLAAEALETGRADTPARCRWLDFAPRYLGRVFGTRQCLRMSDAEISAFLPRLRTEFPCAGVTHTGDAI